MVKFGIFKHRRTFLVESIRRVEERLKPKQWVWAPSAKSTTSGYFAQFLLVI